MLTADLVQTRRKGQELRIVPLDSPMRARAAELAALFLDIAEAHVGRSRAELAEAWAQVPAAPRERRLADGLCKLVEDRCEIDAAAPLDPEELRRGVFLRASAARRQGAFDRQALIESLAAEQQLAPATIEHALYSDLRAAHTLRSVVPARPDRLVEQYELAQAQAVLLRAVRVTVEVECRAAGAYRALFNKLKFLRLLYSIAARPKGGYRIEIDGPFSLFESVTKYGLQLALALPALRDCDSFALTAEVRWGKQRQPLTFRLEGGCADGGAGDESPRLADEVARLLGDLQQLDSAWQVGACADIVSLPGVGLCVPDLVFQHRTTGECVYLEVLGFWSRQAVWRRVELVERGLGERIVFAVSQHLRVSEEALGDELPSALYIYKRVMNARAVLERVEGLARR